MSQLTTNVTLRGPAPDFALKFFGPGDDLPEWALEELADSPHLFADGVSLTSRPTEGAGENKESDNSGSESEKSDDSDDQTSPVTPQNNPPSRNKSAATWAAYLKEKGVSVPEGASRETLIDIAERNGLL